MLDKSLPYYDVLMKRPKGIPVQQVPLPAGYRYVYYQPGDENNWAEIETSVGEFEQPSDALQYFKKEFLPYKEELARRCIFVEHGGDKVGTLTAWWCYTKQRRDPWIHWVAVRPEHQGLGLGKALVSQGLQQMLALEGDCDMYLHTQTWSYKAIGIYQQAGFGITQEKGLGGCENADYDKAADVLRNCLRER